MLMSAKRIAGNVRHIRDESEAEIHRLDLPDTALTTSRRERRGCYFTVIVPFIPGWMWQL